MTAWFALTMLMVCSNTATAQNVGPLLPKGSAELGAQYRWIHRDIADFGEIHEVDLSETSVVGRYGLTKYATISGEFMIANQNFNSVETEVRYYIAGAGVQGLLWDHDRCLLSGNISVSTTFLADRTGTNCDYTHHGFIASVQFQTSYHWRTMEVTPWGGPLYFYYSVERENGVECDYVQLVSPDRIGGVIGVNVLLFDHLVLYGNFIYVDYLQPRMGVSFRF